MDDFTFEATLTEEEFADYAAHMDKHVPGWRERIPRIPFPFNADYLDRQTEVFGRIQDDRESAGVM